MAGPLDPWTIFLDYFLDHFFGPLFGPFIVSFFWTIFFKTILSGGTLLVLREGWDTVYQY